MSTHTATYSCEDNKLRLYIGRVPREEYLKLKAEGWKALHKQREAGHGDFVATWSPDREDTALSYCEEGEDIGDEDYSPEERSADRAERFEGYREKRAEEAGGIADTFEAGPSAFGHQNRARAERQATRHDRNRTRAVSQWSKAEYWQMRTEGVIRHALHKSSASVRRGRLLTLESEQRKSLAGIEESQKRYDGWQAVLTMEGAGQALPEDRENLNPAQRLAYALANVGGCWLNIYHPTNEAANAKALEIWKHGFSPYDLLTKQDFCGIPMEPMTPRQLAELYLSKVRNPSDPDTYSNRWVRHYEFRITYEKAMLENEGGMVGEVEMEPGGWIRTNNRTGSCLTHVATGWKQIQGVNKSPATGRVTSVKVLGIFRSAVDEPRECLVSIDVKRLGEDAYRAPTDEERAAFQTETKTRKAKEKASKPAAPSLVNPTEADALRVQAILNAIGQAKHEAKWGQKWEREHYPYKPTPILRMTQAQYSAASKGSYTSFETLTLHCAGGIIARRSSNMYTSEGSKYDKELGPAVCKVRTRYAAHSGSQWFNPPHIVVITDKPQKPLPALDTPAEVAPEPETVEAIEEAAPVVTTEAREPVAAGQLF